MEIQGKLIKKIWQVDNHSFCIEWNNGEKMRYQLSDLQENCPCARCYQTRNSGIKPLRPIPIKAKSIESVGRYALRIHFEEGCSLGIYDFELLYKMGET